MNPSETPGVVCGGGGRSTASVFVGEGKNHQKPPFRRAVDDSKPFLRDSISRSDPTEAEEAVLRPPTIVIPAKSSMELGGR